MINRQHQDLQVCFAETNTIISSDFLILVKWVKLLFHINQSYHLIKSMADVKLLRKAGDGCVGVAGGGVRDVATSAVLPAPARSPPTPATRPHHPSHHLATRDKTCAADTRRLARFSHPALNSKNYERAASMDFYGEIRCILYDKDG